DGAPSAVAREARRCAMPEAPAQSRPEAVGADEQDAVLLEGVHSAGRSNRDAAVADGEVTDPGAEMELDVCGRRRGWPQRRGHVAGMDHRIGRCMTLLSRGPERRAREHFPGPGGAYSQLVGNDEMRLEALRQPERDEQPRSVGRELDAGADLFHPLGRLD